MSLKELLENNPHKTATISLLISIIVALASFSLFVTGLLKDNASADYSQLKTQVANHVEEDDQRENQNKVILEAIQRDVASIKDNMVSQQEFGKLQGTVEALNDFLDRYNWEVIN